MEPRPPRPRNPQPPFPGGLSGYPAAGQPGSGGQPVYPYAPQPAGGMPLVPPQAVPLAGDTLPLTKQRKRRGMALGVIGFVAGLALLAGLAWFLRDRISPPSGQIAQNPTGQVAVGTPAAVPAVAATATGAPAAANLLATATPTATQPPRPTQAPPTSTPAPPPTPTTDSGVDPAIVPLVEALPGPDLLPAGLLEFEGGERSKGEVVTSLAGGDPLIEAEAEQLLTDWGWEGNAYRNYGPAEGLMSPDGLIAFNVSAHRFADANSADDALIYFSDRVAVAQGLGDVEIPLIGDASRMLSGAPEGSPIAVLYLRDGNTMYRIGAGTSLDAPEADPVAALVAVGQAMMGQ